MRNTSVSIILEAEMSNRSCFWGRYLDAIDAEGVTTSEYARREGLSLGSLYQWRQKLKPDSRGQVMQRSAISDRTGFVAVRVTESFSSTGSPWRLSFGDFELSMPAYPDTSWLVSLAEELGRQKP